MLLLVLLVDINVVLLLGYFSSRNHQFWERYRWWSCHPRISWLVLIGNFLYSIFCVCISIWLEGSSLIWKFQPRFIIDMILLGNAHGNSGLCVCFINVQQYGEILFLLMIDRNHNLSDLVIIIIIAICGHTQFGCLCVWYNWYGNYNLNRIWSDLILNRKRVNFVNPMCEFLFHLVTIMPSACDMIHMRCLN